MSTVLVTGAAGFIGSRLAACFTAQGAHVVRDVDLGAGRARLTADHLAQVTRDVVPTAIVHAAGSGTVGQVEANPARHLPANLDATLTVLDYARAVAPGAHVVFLSSAAVYGSAPDTPQGEGDARDPVSLYGLSKTQSEQLLAYYAQQYGVQGTAVRLFSVYGPGLRKQLLWDAMNKFVAGRCDFFGTGQERRDWVHIDDVCSFMQALFKRRQTPGFDVFNCGGQAATTAEVLSALALQVGGPQPVFNGHTRIGDPLCLVADCSKAQRQLGWQPGVGWAVGIAEYARCFVQQQDGRAGAGPSGAAAGSGV